MDQLSSLAMTLAGRWGSGLAGWAVASTLIWYVLPIVPAFRPPAVRLGLIVLLLAVCVGVNALIGLRRRRRQRALAAELGGGTESADPNAAARARDEEARAEVAALRGRMRDALERLGRGRRDLYERPWYVMIGPPGAGKTTALLQSGLHFPLAREIGAGPVGGVGGTRLCDWWFADEAVLIDTAGRYTTQDSDPGIDRAGWLGFLDMLRKGRPRQPINGVLVTLSVLDLATASDAERLSHARAVRHRIDELTERLRVRPPVYLLLSKADRLLGFEAFFDDLDQTAREQVWGMTFDPAEPATAFAAAFSALMARLDSRLVERLQAERSAERRALIGGFPAQVASLGGAIEAFLREAFSGSRIDPAPFLRGVYLTSATQEGTPIDRLTGLLARSFGIDQARAPALRPAAGRAYFVTALLRDVVLGEALLVRGRVAGGRRRRSLRSAGFAAIGLATVAALALLWRVDANQQSAIAREDEALAAYRQALTAIPLDPVASDDLPQVATLLERARTLQQPHADASALPSGLAQGAKLDQIAAIAYAQALQRIFLPRLLWRLEVEMRARFDDPAFLYQATRVYLMLGGDGPLDPALVRAWMHADWGSRFPGALNAGLRDALGVDLDALLASPLPPVALDGALVEAARATFSRVSLAQRIYSRIRADADADPQGSAAAPDWSPAGALGALGARFFVRRSGQSLTAPIPGFLTGDGFSHELETALPATTREVASESWVLGHAAEVPTDAPHLAALQSAVEALWVADATRAWDALLDDLALAPFGDRESIVQALYVLGSPQSPIRDLLAAILQAATIRPPHPQGAPASGRPGGADAVRGLFGAGSNDAGAAGTGPDARGEQPQAIAAIDDHFAALASLLDGAPPQPIDNILHLVNALQAELASMSPGAAALPQSLQNDGDPAASLLAEADRQPLPVSRWLRQIAAVGGAALGSAAHRSAAAAFAGGGAGASGAGGVSDGGAGDSPQALCRSVVDGHYPFDPNAGDDASVDDFSRLFSPGGALDTYFDAEVKPYVDMDGPTWRLHSVGGVAAPIDAATLARFRRAAEIRDAFFIGAGSAELRFTLGPAPAAPTGGGKAVFSLGGISVATDGPGAVAFTWPVGAGANMASVRFPGRKGDAAPALTEQGPWALFRLLADGRLEPAGSPQAFSVAFTSGTADAVFDLTAGSARNPFGRDLLAGFQCPVVR